jgi:hypothetical protein
LPKADRLRTEGGALKVIINRLELALPAEVALAARAGGGRARPVDFSPWQTLWKRHDKWSTDGSRQRVLEALPGYPDQAGELDSTVAVPGALGATRRLARYPPTVIAVPTAPAPYLTDLS